MNLDNLWTEYGLDELQKGMDTLFPSYEISLEKLFESLMQGDVIGVMSEFVEETIARMAADTIGMKNMFVWLLVLGVLSALMGHLAEVFDKQQVADLSFYFMYLLMGAVLLKCLLGLVDTTVETLENIVLFGRLLVPVYLLTVGISAGSVTAAAYYQLVLVVIYAVEGVLLKIAVPFVYSFCLLTVVNGVWIEEKLTLLTDFLEKIIGWILKASVGVVTGISIFQSVLTPMLDSVRNGAWQKVLSVIPGVGNAAAGTLELMIGSAAVIKNSVGLVLLMLLVFLCAVPIMKIFFTAVFIKAAAAFMGIVSDKRITACVNRMGDASLLLLKIAATACALFFISLAVVATATNRGI